MNSVIQRTLFVFLAAVLMLPSSQAFAGEPVLRKNETQLKVVKNMIGFLKQLDQIRLGLVDPSNTYRRPRALIEKDQNCQLPPLEATAEEAKAYKCSPDDNPVGDVRSFNCLGLGVFIEKTRQPLKELFHQSKRLASSGEPADVFTKAEFADLFHLGKKSTLSSIVYIAQDAVAYCAAVGAGSLGDRYSGAQAEVMTYNQMLARFADFRNSISELKAVLLDKDLKAKSALLDQM